MRSSQFLKPVTHLQRPTCSGPFFSLPSFPFPRFGSLENGIEKDGMRQNASDHDEDEPEGNEAGVQR